MRTLTRMAAVGAALAATALAAPQAIAQNAPASGQHIAGTSVQLSPKAARNAQTRALAAANPTAVSAAATLCGSGYKLDNAEQLPDSRRFGTLFTYTKYVGGVHGVCSLFDNNLGTAKHMKLKLCAGLTALGCKTDEGTFKDYAGPVKIENRDPLAVICAPVTAIMWSDGVAIIDRQRSSTACD
ncbi:hypothetical protein AQI88_26545 [Streptomyces cellostaticus]|uniref:Uncharacterized protein n=1 Tax=Streptomyces cellostaticus TaxID=67285 RepID=A0A101NHE5_9ACTN|nr:hypothetical protein [Streptomyces cellostaticus]KUM93343.1 hypothetical protein AQI88_26545 [Streptomyces cellostaticus]GHI02320.1 hypothetical protein Scel_06410 [Streptomyces cellostaticus]